MADLWVASSGLLLASAEIRAMAADEHKEDVMTTRTPGNDRVPTSIKVLAWSAVAIAVAASVAGYALNLWEGIRWFDGAVHAFMTFAFTLLLGA